MRVNKSTRAITTIALALIAILWVALTVRQRAEAQTASPSGPQIAIDADGTYHIPAQAIPVTGYLSPEGKASLLYYDNAERDPNHTKQNAEGYVELFRPYRESQAKLFPLNKQDTQIAGVHVFIYTPKDGVPEKNKNRILINLHGGAFRNCWLDCGTLESQPIAYTGKFKVVSVDYRQGTDHPFPAASEDVAKVYTELLKSYPRQNIGIYGCSAGGRQTGMSIAWFETHSIPLPGAAGVFCAGEGGPRGDAAYTSAELGEGNMSMTGPTDVDARQGYFRTADPKDPNVQPVYHPDILAKYPSTLVVTGTRAHDVSASVYFHSRLVLAGVDAQLYVVEGGRHGFWYDPVPPESKEVYSVIVKFFDKHLANAPMKRDMGQ